MDPVFLTSGLIGILLENNTVEEFPENVKDLLKKIQKVDSSNSIDKMYKNLKCFTEMEFNYLNNTFLDRLKHCIKEYKRFSLQKNCDNCDMVVYTAVENDYLEVLEYLDRKFQIINTNTHHVLRIAARSGSINILNKFFTEDYANLVVNNAIAYGQLEVCKQYERYITSDKKRLTACNDCILESFESIRFFIKKGFITWRNVVKYASRKDAVNYADFIIEELSVNFIELFDLLFCVNNFYEKMAKYALNQNYIHKGFLLQNICICTITNMNCEFFDFIFDPQYNFDVVLFFNKSVVGSNLKLSKHLMQKFSIPKIALPVESFTFDTLIQIVLNFEEHEYDCSYYKFVLSNAGYDTFKNLVDKSHFNYEIFNTYNQDKLMYAMDKYFDSLSSEKIREILEKRFVPSCIRDTYLTKLKDKLR